MKNISVIILAAGMGTRMKSSLPKALITLGNVPLIDHAIVKSNQINANTTTVVISPNMHNLKDHINKTYNNSIIINYQDPAQGSGHAVKCGINDNNKNSDVTLILYVDTPLISSESLKQLTDSVLNNTCDIAVLSFTAPLPNGYGKLIFNQNNQFSEIIEAKELPTDSKLNICNSGVMAIKTSLLVQYIEQINNNNSKGEYYLTDMVKILTSNGYKAHHISAHIQEVEGANSKEELSQLESIFQNQMRSKFLQSGVQITDPNTVYFSLDTKIGNDVIIQPNVFIGPNTVIEDNVIIQPFCHLHGATIGKGSTVGPFARLRPQAVLGENTHIGNFVEIKKSNLQNGVKVNHLSYVGDCNIGEKTNIGAGFISCNYDGVNKHTTNIGSNSFIGSHVATIAPINIGNNVLVAAGSTITDDIPNNTMAIARSKQVNKLNYIKK